jgi:hypothetical protein
MRIFKISYWNFLILISLKSCFVFQGNNNENNNTADTIFCDTLVNDTCLIDTVFISDPIIISLCKPFICIVDTFSIGEEKFFIVDIGGSQYDTIQIFHSEKTWYIVSVNFKDTIINRSNTVYDHKNSVNTSDISSLIIKATGTICDNVYPYLKLYVNDSFVRDISIDNSNKDSIYKEIIKKSFTDITSLKLEYDNDCYHEQPYQDRNIFIYQVKINNLDITNNLLVTGYISNDDNFYQALSNGQLLWEKEDH